MRIDSPWYLNYVHVYMENFNTILASRSCALACRYLLAYFVMYSIIVANTFLISGHFDSCDIKL